MIHILDDLKTSEVDRVIKIESVDNYFEPNNKISKSNVNWVEFQSTIMGHLFMNLI